jgi:hypothetical protein
VTGGGGGRGTGLTMASWPCRHCRAEIVAAPPTSELVCWCGRSRRPGIDRSCAAPCPLRLCAHPCPRRCHPGRCPPCTLQLHMPCHCGRGTQISCADVTAAVTNRASPTAPAPAPSAPAGGRAAAGRSPSPPVLAGSPAAPLTAPAAAVAAAVDAPEGGGGRGGGGGGGGGSGTRALQLAVFPLPAPSLSPAAATVSASSTAAAGTPAGGDCPSDLIFSCGGVCDRPLACGRHRCERVCHPGQCSTWFRFSF